MKKPNPTRTKQKQKQLGELNGSLGAIRSYTVDSKTMYTNSTLHKIAQRLY